MAGLGMAVHGWSGLVWAGLVMTGLVMAVHGWSGLVWAGYGWAGLGWAWLGIAGHGWAWLGVAGRGWAWLDMAGLECSLPSFPSGFFSSTGIFVSGLWGENGFVSITNVPTIVAVQREEAGC